MKDHPTGCFEQQGHGRRLMTASSTVLERNEHCNILQACHVVRDFRGMMPVPSDHLIRGALEE